MDEELIWSTHESSVYLQLAQTNTAIILKYMSELYDDELLY